MLNNATATAVGTLLAAARRDHDAPFTREWATSVTIALAAVQGSADAPSRRDVLTGLIKTIALMARSMAWETERTVEIETTVMLRHESWAPANVLMARDYVTAGVKAAHANDFDGLLDQVNSIVETQQIFEWGFMIATAIGGEMVVRCQHAHALLPPWVESALELPRRSG